ncbi:VC0807 family protein [Paenibacillus sp. D2_2]|uniref:VC0807 family protein n=1 Tax=Paenibacillus sp. D2_2 TaxID=3073092 RepID=UPI00281551C6|nr:VC0807 family protein [Paenibacillus sp. D2_2]WMT43363.1 VC0807 family protein [Paenibacillus sp. D2_2]
MHSPQKHSVIISIAITICCNGILPYLIYIWLKDDMSSLTALIIATTVPLLENMIYFAKYRKLDTFGLLMISTFLLSIILAISGGNEKMVLLRESFVTGFVGALFISSLAFEKPLIYQFAQRFVSQVKANIFAERWSHPYIRFVFRLMTVVWGLMMLGEAMLRIYLIQRYTTKAFLWISQLLFYGVIGTTILWTLFYRRYASQKYLRLMQIK